MPRTGTPTRRARLAAATVLALVLLGACGDDPGTQAVDPTSPTASQTSPGTTDTPEEPEETTSPEEPEPTIPPNARACSEVWRAEGQIPRAYPGCLEGEEFVEREGRACSSGQRLLRYRNFYGVAGGKVHVGTKPLSKDPGFRRAGIDCVA